jgi:hypothetical protein
MAFSAMMFLLNLVKVGECVHELKGKQYGDLISLLLTPQIGKAGYKLNVSQCANI